MTVLDNFEGPAALEFGRKRTQAEHYGAKWMRRGDGKQKPSYRSLAIALQYCCSDTPSAEEAHMRINDLFEQTALRRYHFLALLQWTCQQNGVVQRTVSSSAGLKKDLSNIVHHYESVVAEHGVEHLVDVLLL